MALYVWISAVGTYPLDRQYLQNNHLAPRDPSTTVAPVARVVDVGQRKLFSNPFKIIVSMEIIIHTAESSEMLHTLARTVLHHFQWSNLKYHRYGYGYLSWCSCCRMFANLCMLICIQCWMLNVMFRVGCCGEQVVKQCVNVMCSLVVGMLW